MLSPGLSFPFPLPSVPSQAGSACVPGSWPLTGHSTLSTVPLSALPNLFLPIRATQGHRMPTPGYVPCTVESPYVPSRSAPFAAKRMVKRTESRVRQMGVQIQPQHVPPCDFKPSPQLSALHFPPQHSGGVDTSLGARGLLWECVRRCVGQGPQAWHMAELAAVTATPQNRPASAGPTCGPSSGPLWRDTFGLGVSTLVAAGQIHAGV